MPLKITLKPYERLIIGGAVIANGSAATHLTVENNVPILRQKDIMSLKSADSPCRRIYFAIQLMYVDGKDLPEQHRIYWELINDVIEAAPSTEELIAEISDLVLKKEYYRALKLTKRLMEYEREATKHVRKADRSVYSCPENEHVRPGNRGFRTYPNGADTRGMPGQLGCAGSRTDTQRCASKEPDALEHLPG